MKAKDVERIYNISEIYLKLRKKELTTSHVLEMAKRAIKTKNFDMVEKLSNLIFARGEEDEKLDLAKELYRGGLIDLVPLPYRKMMKYRMDKGEMVKP